MSINNGGPAFPSPEWSDAHGNIAPMEYGMTMRDYFAAKAMQGLIVNEAGTELSGKSVYSAIATLSYRIADAMLAEGGKGE